MKSSNVLNLPTRAELFYKDVLSALYEKRARYLVGGSVAMAYYMHLARLPKDLDLFVCRQDCTRILSIVEERGYTTRVIHPHWLAKAYKDDLFIDFIFCSGNGLSQVDSSWFDYAVDKVLFGVPVKLCTPEDILWSKAFVMDRERFDGADIAHLLHECGQEFNWPWLLARFGIHWRVLLAHLLLLEFIYPGKRIVPEWARRLLLKKAQWASCCPPEGQPVCQGTLLSRDQYLCDVEVFGYLDGRLSPTGKMTGEQISQYTAAFRKDPGALSNQQEKIAAA
jgi:hypothetical protein